MGNQTTHGVTEVSVKATGEALGQYGYELSIDDDGSDPQHIALQVDLPIAPAVRWRAAGLALRLMLEDGREIEFTVSDIGPGGVEVEPVALTQMVTPLGRE